MQETTNLKLKKPDLTDYVNVADLNENADKIDTAITTNKDNLTTHKADGKAHGIGDKALLKTTDKTSLVGAINEAFTSASNGKSAVSAAITGVDPEVVIPPEPTFPQLATAIGQINTGKKWASGVAKSGASQSPGNFLFGAGASSLYDLTVSGLGFKPSIIVAFYQVTTYPGYAPESSSTTYIRNGSLLVSPEQFFATGTATNQQATSFTLKPNARHFVIDGGFTIPVYYFGSTLFTWIAIE